MLKKRKSQGLSITTIIIAVVGLIILVVLISLLTGRLGGFSKGVQTTSTCSQVCQTAGYTSGSETPDGGTQTPGILESEGKPCTCTGPP